MKDKPRARTLVGLFLVSIWLPLLVMGAQLKTGNGWSEALVGEMPAANQGTTASLGSSSSLDRFQAWFRKHFGLRSTFVRWNGLLMVRGLQASPNEGVVIGKQGWLFLDKEDTVFDHSAMVYYRRVKPFTEKELAAWTSALENERAWLAAKGIPFLFVVAPNKDTIYPEFVPDRIRQEARPSRLDQLLAYLPDHSRVEVVDLRAALLRAKGGPPLYSKTDTHWNECGALAASEEILRHLQTRFPTVRTSRAEDYRLRWQTRPCGDLGRVAGLRGVVTEALPLFEPVEETAVRVTEEKTDFSRLDVQSAPRIATEAARGEIARGLIFRDSFGEALIPFLSPHFRHVTYSLQSFTGFDPELVEAEHPDVVLQVLVERRLLSIPDPAGGH